jgi:hypothetical protein
MTSAVPIGEAEHARIRGVARELGLPRNASRSDVSVALAHSRIAAPALPVAFDDSQDVHDLLRVPASGHRVVPPRIASRTPHYTIRVRAVFCADSDGSNPCKVTQAHLGPLLAGLSALYAPAGLSFTLSSTATLYNTMINQDFTVPSGLDYTNPDAQPMTQAQMDASFDAHNAARNAWARKYRGQLVIFFRYGTKFRWDDAAKKWTVGKTSFAFSGSIHEFVAMGPDAPPEAVLLAHESGHFFHLAHTHNDKVTLTAAEKKTYADWQTDPALQAAAAKVLRDRMAQAIRAFVDDKGNPPQKGLDAFDADHLADTPQDPGPSLFTYENGDPCKAGPITVDVALTSGKRAYTVTPNVDLLMSYFFRCPGLKRFSDAQMDLLRASLEKLTFTTTVKTAAGNVMPVLSRHHLIAPTYHASGPGTVVAKPANRLTRWLRGLTGTARVAR